MKTVISIILISLLFLPKFVFADNTWQFGPIRIGMSLSEFQEYNTSKFDDVGCALFSFDKGKFRMPGVDPNRSYEFAFDGTKNTSRLASIAFSLTQAEEKKFVRFYENNRTQKTNKPLLSFKNILKNA